MQKSSDAVSSAKRPRTTQALQRKVCGVAACDHKVKSVSREQCIVLPPCSSTAGPRISLALRPKRCVALLCAQTNQSCVLLEQSCLCLFEAAQQARGMTLTPHCILCHVHAQQPMTNDINNVPHCGCVHAQQS